jgi:asparagine synthase (glutamine-hydrolysing)
MCGILGVISSEKKNSNESEIWVKRGLDTIGYRGPDGSGIFVSRDEKAVLGHRRLSIIELSSLGAQPMYRDDLGLMITFNGEIYNYQEIKRVLVSKGYSFKSNSDTEVLLVAYAFWGKKFLSYLNGMFAFSLYDENKKTTIIARDRAGEKPLYYYQKSNELYFASEVKALLLNEKVEKKINHAGLSYYLSLGYIPSPQSIINDVFKLKPGHYLEIKTDTFSVIEKKYWDLPRSENKSSETELVEELDILLKDSVKRQLISDVPVGVLLSGGVDSSIITAYASEVISHVNTFSIRFPGYGALDETKHARIIADYFSTNHFELDANDVINLEGIEKICSSFDEPINDSSLIPTFLVSKLVRGYCTVALGGDGGDELFGGYGKYLDFLTYRKRFDKIPFRIREKISNAAISLMPVGMKGRNWLQFISCDYSRNKFLFQNHFDLSSQKSLLKETFSKNLGFDFIYEQLTSNKDDLIRNATELDFRTYLPEDILVKVDRASMLNSLEIRAPFLDYNIIEFAFKSVPSYLKVNNGNKKILLKSLCKRKLPQEFDYNRKQGFSMPLLELMKNKKSQTFIEEKILDSDLQLFDDNYLKKLVASINNGRMNSERIFGLLFLSIWLNKYKLSL